MPAEDKAWIRTPIDAFIRARQRELGLPHAPEADRRTLIRRLAYDLVGLPPTPEEIAAFEADTHPQAYERLVDRLLESPHYGERWARHWLDVVHFGETHGYDKDKLRLNAWPYRDYVIRSLNADKPYGRFVQEQVAGDILFPGTAEGMEALGFIAAGPWDFIGHAEVPESKIDGKVARHLDRDDMVTNTLQTFNSLTVQCAQCHNHKFDPILQKDYYRLQAVFAAVDRTEKKYDSDPNVATQRLTWEAELQRIAQDRTALDAHMAQVAGEPLQKLNTQIAALEKNAKPGSFPAEFGYHSGLAAEQATVKWVQLDLGELQALTKIVIHPCHDDFNNIGDGFGFPLRFKLELSNDAEFREGNRLVLDSTETAVANPKLAPQTVAVEQSARYIRFTATRLAPRMNDFILALSELEAFKADGTNVARGAKVTALDSIEAPNRWAKANLVDGLYAGMGSEAVAELGQLREAKAKLLAASSTAAERGKLEELALQESELTKKLAALPPQQVAYVAAIHHGSGTFSGTGASGGQPRPIHVLHRGSVTQPGEEVAPGALTTLPTWPGEFNLPGDHTEGDRRAALARWLADRRNPLTWRSIVNRVWQYHFGRGLVETSNDFGRNGGLPTHPALLDYLAAEFRDGNQSLKELHRTLVRSSVYRQQSQMASAVEQIAAEEKDAENRYLWHMNRRKLEAELVRDSVLQLAGKLNRTLYGPSFQDFVIEKPEHSPHFEYLLHDPEDAKSHRRSIYRFLVRSQPQPFMATLDCADPSMQVERRNESLSALQALALLNNSFMVSMSKHFAARLEATPGDLPTKIARAYEEATGRPANEQELQLLVSFAEEHGLPNLCRVLLNMNEFVFVE